MSIKGKWTTGLILLAAFLVLLNVLPFEQWLQPVYAYFDQSKDAGIIQYSLLGAILTILFVPVSIPITGAGFIFGFSLGLAAAFLILIAGSSAGFFVGKFFWKRLGRNRLTDQPVFHAVQQAIEKHGRVMIPLLRMTPFLHFMTGNLFFGSLNIRFVPYILLSVLGMLPGTALLVYGGSLAGSSPSDGPPTASWQVLLFIAGLIAFVAVARWITSYVKQVLQPSSMEKSTTSAR